MRTGCILVFMVAALPPVPCLADGLFSSLGKVFSLCKSSMRTVPAESVSVGDAEGSQTLQYRVDLALMIILPLLSVRMQL